MLVDELSISMKCCDFISVVIYASVENANGIELLKCLLPWLGVM